MKAVVLISFRDKHNRKILHPVGEVVDFNDDRVAALAARGLVKAIPETTNTDGKGEDKKGKPGKSDNPGKGKKDKKGKTENAETPAPDETAVEKGTDNATEDKE